MFQEASQIQYQLYEVNLGDSDRELANMNEEVENQLRVLKGILDQIDQYEGQPDTARVNIKDLLKKKPDPSGYDILEDNVNDMKAKDMVFDPGG